VTRSLASCVCTEEEAEVRERLLKFPPGTSSADAGGHRSGRAPYAAALFYAIDDELSFYVVTDPATRHGQAMLANPSVAGTIQL